MGGWRAISIRFGAVFCRKFTISCTRVSHSDGGAVIFTRMLDNGGPSFSNHSQFPLDRDSHRARLKVILSTGLNLAVQAHFLLILAISQQRRWGSTTLPPPNIRRMHISVYSTESGYQLAVLSCSWLRFEVVVK